MKRCFRGSTIDLADLSARALGFSGPGVYFSNSGTAGHCTLEAGNAAVFNAEAPVIRFWCRGIGNGSLKQIESGRSF